MGVLSPPDGKCGPGMLVVTVLPDRRSMRQGRGAAGLSWPQTGVPHHSHCPMAGTVQLQESGWKELPFPHWGYRTQVQYHPSCYFSVHKGPESTAQRAYTLFGNSERVANCSQREEPELLHLPHNPPVKLS